MKRPWNIVDMPVYSLATYEENKVNMNICTYVTAVSMKPKMFMIAVYYDTKTYENLQEHDECVLQILTDEHKKLINYLGKKSGKEKDKQQYLEKQGLLENWADRKVLKNSAGLLKLKVAGRQNIGGDHELYWFALEKSKTNSEENILMFQTLVNDRIIL